MKQILKEPQSALLKEIVSRRCPQLAERTQSADISELDREERRTIIRALGSELMASGLDKDSEPTQRGLQIEQLIDIVNRPNLKVSP